MLCRFAQFPDLRQLRQLAVLHMHDNSVGRLPSSIGELVNLVTLDMGENSLTEIRCVLIHVSVSHSYTPTAHHTCMHKCMHMHDNTQPT